jgi:FkbH-like protein
VNIPVSASRRVFIVSDCVSKALFRLRSDDVGCPIAVEHCDIDQHLQVLLSGVDIDALIVHVGFRYFDFRDSPASIRQKLDELIFGIESFLKRQDAIVILNTVHPPVQRIVGRHHLEALSLASEINERFIGFARRERRVSIADVAAVLAQVGLDRAINVQNDWIMRMPFTGAAIPSIVSEYARVLRERFVARKKVLIIDADNTLWRGVVGEDGVEGIDIGEDYPGTVFHAFQRQLLEAKRSGLVLAMVSKNNLVDVKEVFERRAMPLKWDDFTCHRVNWNRKSENIASIAQELDLGVDSFVMIDDNPFELEEVANSLPGVTVQRFDWQKPAEALSLLCKTPGLSAWEVTAEDTRKALQYAEESQRREVRASAGSLEDYIRSLEIRIEVGRNREEAVARVTQLTNKTNQFNLTTRRYSEAEIRAAMTEGSVYDFRVIDRLGDMGVVGVVIVRDDEIEAFLMSCRALGREIEGNMLAYVCDRHESQPLRAAYLPTAKNSMVSDFYDRNGFQLVQSNAGAKQYKYVGMQRALVSVPITEV